MRNKKYKKVSESLKLRWKDPEFKEKMKEIHRKSYKEKPRIWLKNTGRTRFKKGHIPYNKDLKGYCHSGTFKKGHPSYLTKEAIEKIRKKLKGKKKSEEHRKKISKAMKGEKNPMYGRKGILHPRWKKERKLLRKKHEGIEYNEWRKAIFRRDNFTCQKCGQYGGNLIAHHIFNFADFPELRLAIDNGITLCKKCHNEFHKRFGKTNNTKEQLEEFLSRS
jgi:hypothetical protein